MVAVYNFTGYLHTLIFLNEKIIFFSTLGGKKKKKKVVGRQCQEGGMGNASFPLHPMSV